jgi:hypothetical protein
MRKAKDEPKISSGPKLDRRAVIRGALAVGGVSAVSRAAAMPQGITAEREWARALARHVANQLPEAAAQVPNLGLTGDQIEQLRKAFENTLVTNMGCENPPG